MSTSVAQKSSNKSVAANAETPAKASPDSPTTPPVDLPQTNAEKIRAQATTEALAFMDSVRTIVKSGESLGAIALTVLAESLGESANKLGKPGETAYLAFLLAMSHRKADYGQRAELARRANGAVPMGHKPVAIVRAKASAAQGQASYRFNAPAAIEIALGE